MILAPKHLALLEFVPAEDLDNDQKVSQEEFDTWPRISLLVGLARG